MSHNLANISKYFKLAPSTEDLIQGGGGLFECGGLFVPILAQKIFFGGLVKKIKELCCTYYYQELSCKVLRQYD